jgi:hypothetical protein
MRLPKPTANPVLAVLAEEPGFNTLDEFTTAQQQVLWPAGWVASAPQAGDRPGTPRRNRRQPPTPSSALRTNQYGSNSTRDRRTGRDADAGRHRP